MSKAFEYVTVYTVGAGGYTLIELLWRGYTHWTMSLAGGLCFLMIYVSEKFFADEKLWKRCLVGCLSITLVELAVGCLVNMCLEWRVWDYSDMVLDVGGQICLLYSVLWFLLCVPVIALCGCLRKMFCVCERNKDVW